MSLAKKDNPDLIVVCVEAQPTNGYMLCTRLKKDDQLKDIPVILTSANATPDSFEKHKKLKTRAEEYLIKPFAPQAMLEKASQLLGVKLAPEQQGESVGEAFALGDLEGEDEPISLSAADVAEARSALTEDPLVVDEVEEVVEIQEEAGGDDELEELQEQARQLKDDAVKREAAAKTLQQRADALATAAKKLERDKGGSDELKTRMKQLEKELESARAELSTVTGEKDLLAEERDELKKQLEESQASGGQNEDRAVKAYARIKNAEKLREKARKALEIALQLLETASEHEDDESEKSA